MTKTFLLFLLATGMPQVAATGQGEGDEPLVYAGYAAFPVHDLQRIPTALAKPLMRGGGLEPGYFLVHQRGGSVPEPATLHWVDDFRDLVGLRRLARVDWVGRFQPAYKLDPALAPETLGEARLLLEVELVPGHPARHVAAELEALGACVCAHATDSLVIETRPDAVTRIAWVEGILRLHEHHDHHDTEHDDHDDHDENGAAGEPGLGEGRTRGSAERGARQESSAPITLALAVTGGLDSDRGTLSTTEVARLRASDDSRLALRDRAQLTLAFERTVPADAVVSAIRLLVEHHEEPRVDAGEILWKLGHGTLASPAIVESVGAPLRSGEGLEALDAWGPDGLVPDPNALAIVIENSSRNDDTLLDRVYVEIDYSLPERAPSITSSPNPLAVVRTAYGYDADGRAEASGAAPIAWSLFRGPPGFSIDTSGQVAWVPESTGSFAISLQAANAHGVATQSFSVEVLAEPPLPPTLLPASPAYVVYCPLERLALGPPKTQQRLNVFLPRGTPPPSGWPVVLNNRAGGGLAALPLASLHQTGGTAPLYAFVAEGVAVVDFGVTGVGDGNGLFYPPGHASGRYESFRPADDNPEKDAEWAVQWLKTQETFPLDPARICLRGSSHGAIISMWAAMGPEHARAGGSAQVRASTRVKAVLALQPPTSVWAFDQGPDLLVRLVAHYEQEGLPGVPATAFGQVAESLQKAGSVMGFAFDTPEARANNEAQALCLVFNEPVMRVAGVPADLTLDARGYPNLHDTLIQPFIHDSWAGYVLFKRLLELSPRSAAFHRQRSIFAMRDTSALAPPLDFHTHTYSGGINGDRARALAQRWVLETLGATPPLAGLPLGPSGG
jgi:hypothetical protein